MAETGTQTPFEGVGWRSAALFVAEVILFAVISIAGLFISTRVFEVVSTGSITNVVLLFLVPGVLLALAHRGVVRLKQR